AIFLIIMLFCLNLPAVQTESGSYEDQLVFHLVETYAKGEVVWLGADGNPFLGLLRQAHEGGAGRVAIILHSMGGHADWPEIIAPLRTGLPTEGWATLSIQLPVLSPRDPIARYGETLDQSETRIRSAVRYLRERGYSDLVLIGYSFGATSAVNYLAKNNADIRAFAGISMQRHAFLSPTYNLIEELEKVTVPILDVYADQDFSEVVVSADVRRLAANKNGHKAYHQLVIEDADHYFSGQQDTLLAQVAKWLGSIVPDEMPVDTEPRYFL
ncbi:MAG: DUF3530 family protein, partial [Gammaproteobacteria bacterium]